MRAPMAANRLSAVLMPPPPFPVPRHPAVPLPSVLYSFIQTVPLMVPAPSQRLAAIAMDPVPVRAAPAVDTGTAPLSNVITALAQNAMAEVTIFISEN